MSGSPAGVAAAIVRYGEAERSLVGLDVVAERLIDLRDHGMCAELGIDPGRTKEDWIAALDRGEEPASWAISDRARRLGAVGLIDESRRAPREWHLVLFEWDGGAGAKVSIAPDRGPTRK
jgi:RES domain-containing protein